MSENGMIQYTLHTDRKRKNNDLDHVKPVHAFKQHQLLSQNGNLQSYKYTSTPFQQLSRPQTTTFVNTFHGCHQIKPKSNLSKRIKDSQNTFFNMRNLQTGAPPRNTLAPFLTHQKPTCGFKFSWDTDHKKKNFGIMPSNLVMWRTTERL